MNDARNRLHQVERLMLEGIGCVREGNNRGGESAFLRAREIYLDLAKEVSEPLRLLVRNRRVHSRIDRIVRSLRGEGEIEYYDVLDESGRPTGAREASTLAHLRGTRHASLVVLFFNRAGETLLQLRSPILAIFPSKWTFAATGHLSAGQDSRAAARAEIIEEVRSPLDASEKASPQWLNFQPREENLIRVGGENEFNSALYLAEFVYWDLEEKLTLESEIRRGLAGETSSGIARILSDCDESANTISIFTFDAETRGRAERFAAQVEEKTGIPRGMVTDNVENRSLYLYLLSEEEEQAVEKIIELKRKSAARSDDSLTADFAWKPFAEVVRDFNNSPERYTDGFVPFLSDPAIVRRIETASRR